MLEISSKRVWTNHTNVTITLSEYTASGQERKRIYRSKLWICWENISHWNTEMGYLGCQNADWDNGNTDDAIKFAVGRST